MKKIARYLAIALMATCLILAFAACKSIPTKPDSTSAGTSDQPQATLAFTTDSITVEQYQQADVSAALTEGEGEIEYSIDDPDVLIMNGTHVMAVKPGKAIVTAKVTSLNLTATCTVTVTEAADKPAFSQSDSVTMYYGAEEQLDGELLRGGEPFAYATVSYFTEGETLSVDEQGNLTALAVGTQNVKITAKIGNYTVAEKDVAVTVKEYGYIETGIENNEINLTATALAEGAISEYTLNALNASVNFEDVENPTFNFETDNESVAVVEGSAVKATGIGTAYITITYTSSYATYDTVLTVNVTRETLEATASAEYLLSTDGKVAIDATALSYAVDAATLEKAYISEDECAFTVEGNTIFVTSDKFGSQSITLVDGMKTVTFASLITDNAISTAEQFKTYFSEGPMNQYKYTILLNNIDMQGAEWGNWTGGVSGDEFHTVFDGRGYTVSNFTLTYGMFYRAYGGTIKNVTFDNYGYGNYGIFGGYWTNGFTVENVTINAHQTQAIPEKKLLFNYNQDWDIVFSNCTFNITAYASETDTAYTLFDNSKYYDVVMKNVTINYTGTLNKDGLDDFNTSHVRMIDVTLKDIRDFGVNYDAAYLMASEGKVALDLSKFSKAVASVTAVTVNGAAADFTEADGTLTVDCAATGNVGFKFTMAENEYTCNILVADNAISTAEQFKTYFSEGPMNQYKYTILLNNIDMQGAEWGNWTGGVSGDEFHTVFDGRGYTVSNFTLTYGMFYRAYGGTIKNVTFDNYGYGNYGIFGGYWTNGFVVENVTINAHQTQAIPEKRLLFLYNQDWDIVLKNCTFNITAYGTETDVAYLLFDNSKFYDVTMRNVTINYTGTINKDGLNDFSISHVVMSDVTLKDINDSRVAYDAEYVLANEGKVAFDLSKFSKTVSGVTAVAVNGAAATFVEAEGVLTVDCAATGTVAFKVTMAANEYNFSILVADNAISTAEQFMTYFSEGPMNQYKYTILLNNIDMQGAEWGNWTGGVSGDEFHTVFDGRGYTVSNFTLTYGMFYRAYGGTIKNVTFDNYGYGNYGIFGGNWTNGFTVENVTINAHQTQAIPEKKLLFNYNQDWDIVLKNCTINITAYESETDVAYLLFDNSKFYDVTMRNVTINYTGTMNKDGLNDFSISHVAMSDVTLKDKRDGAISYGADYVLANEGKIALELNKFSKTVSGVTAVTVNGTAATFTEADGVITIDCSAASKVTLQLSNDTFNYTCYVIVADYAISTAEQFMDYFSDSATHNHKYTVLLNDIDMQGANFGNWSTDFATVFDGRGYTVSNFTMNYGLVYKSVAGTIKNLNIDNFGYGAHGMFGGWYHDGLTVENVNVNAHMIVVNNDDKALLFYTLETDKVSFTNCTFNITALESEVDTPYMLFYNDAYYNVTMTNVTVNYTGTLIKAGETGHKLNGNEMTFGDQVTMTNVTLKDISDSRVAYDAEYVLANEGKVAFDLSKFSKTVSDVTAVAVNGAAADFTEADGTLTVDCAATGNVGFKFTMAENEYTCYILVADNAISTAEQFKTYFSEGPMNQYKYTILLNNIDMQGAEWGNWTGGLSGDEFHTVFDGRGYTVSNFTLTYGMFYKANGGTIKNVTFDNYGYGNYGIFGGYWTNGFVVENVTINAHQTQAIPEKRLLFLYNQDWDIVLKNCTINITAYESETDVAYSLFDNSNYYDVTMRNVTINYTGTMNKDGENGFSYAHFAMSNVTLKDKRDN